MATSRQLQSKYGDLQETFQGRVDRLSDQLTNGDISEFEWRTKMRSAISDYYEKAYRLGAGVSDGGIVRLTDTDRAIIRNEVNEEYKYLGSFYQDLKNYDLSSDYITWRAGMYGNGLTSVYWAGRSSRMDDMLYEAWFISEEDERSCESCPLAADNSPYVPSECPLPGSAVCEGFTNCRCTIEYRNASPEYLANNFPDSFADYLSSARADLRKRVGFKTFAQMRAAATQRYA